MNSGRRYRVYLYNTITLPYSLDNVAPLDVCVFFVCVPVRVVCVCVCVVSERINSRQEMEGRQKMKRWRDEQTEGFCSPEAECKAMQLNSFNQLSSLHLLKQTEG